MPPPLPPLDDVEGEVVGGDDGEVDITPIVILVASIVAVLCCCALLGWCLFRRWLKKQQKKEMDEQAGAMLDRRNALVGRSTMLEMPLPAGTVGLDVTAVEAWKPPPPWRSRRDTVQMRRESLHQQRKQLVREQRQAQACGTPSSPEALGPSTPSYASLAQLGEPSETSSTRAGASQPVQPTVQEEPLPPPTRAGSSSEGSGSTSLAVVRPQQDWLAATMREWPRLTRRKTPVPTPDPGTEPPSATRTPR